MSERPTRETDAVLARLVKNKAGNSCDAVVIHHARKLERERDEAREDLQEIKEYGTEEINAAIELRQKLAQALVDLYNMQDQRDLEIKVIKRLERERDEAREDLRLFKHDKKHLCDSHRDKRGNCMVCSMEEAK